ncbi:MAG: ferrochelatase [Planctomycetes bacterium]|nr:ferrochelatase [Planctomycetota bacterium]
MDTPIDSFLLVSFGGPEGPDDVLPFLENVLRGRNVPRERMLTVAEHYQQFGGVSPINAQNRALLVALRDELRRHGPELPLYFGNRNWHPLLPDTLRQMAADGRRRAVAFFTSAFSSYSGCRQYRENVMAAQQEVGTSAPRVDKLRMFYNHPGFVEPSIENVVSAWRQVPESRRAAARVVFTAHSIPSAMADQCKYEDQLRETAGLIMTALPGAAWQLAYQSRSGPPNQPWLEPDILDVLRTLAAEGVRDVVVMPVGFVSDHLEVMYDLDTAAQQLAHELGMNLVRAATVGTHPRFVTMIRELIVERIAAEQGGAPARPALGCLGPSHDVCPVDCCLPPARPAGRNA